MALILLFGFIGGIIRGTVGFIKHQLSYKDTKFDVKHFTVIVFLSGIIGLIVANAFSQGPLFALVVGYAGGDFLENVYKAIKK